MRLELALSSSIRAAPVRSSPRNVEGHASSSHAPPVSASRWSQLITHVTCTGTSTLPAGQLLISAELKEIDGEGGVLGAAGPHTVAQRCPAVSLTGQMIFDEDDVDDIDDAGYLEGVIQHEMGHTLGLG